MSKNILIIGGDGYIGSKLCQDMEEIYNLSIVDNNLFETNKKKISKISCDYNLLEEDYLSKFTHIILLAGHSSVRMCDMYPNSIFNNNVRNFINLFEKIKENQTLIYASSASVYGNTNEKMISENKELKTPYNMYDLTKQMIDQYSLLSNNKKRFFGLRFGTVNGYSPTLRDDVMINAMTNSAWKHNKIFLYNEETNRSILGTNDLSNAIQAIIESNNSSGGIYNLSSFTKTSGEIAQIVSKKTGCEIEKIAIDGDYKLVGNEKLVSSKYNFFISSDKFIKDFSFDFTDTAETIMDSLILNKEKMIMTNRNNSYNYKG